MDKESEQLAETLYEELVWVVYANDTANDAYAELQAAQRKFDATKVVYEDMSVEWIDKLCEFMKADDVTSGDATELRKKYLLMSSGESWNGKDASQALADMYMEQINKHREVESG